MPWNMKAAKPVAKPAAAIKINPGVRVRIPKGTRVVRDWETVTTTRNTVVTVNRCSPGSSASVNVTNWGFNMNSTFVFWGSSNFVDAVDVELVTEEAKPRKEAKISLNRQMILGSEWRFTQDVDVMKKVLNPKFYDGQYAVLLKLRAENFAGDFSDESERRLIASGVPKFFDVLWASVKAGETFVVNGKVRPGYHTGAGMIADVKFRGKDVEIPLDGIKDRVKAVSIPDAVYYTLRDETTGLYFKRFEAMWDHNAQKVVMTECQMDKRTKAKRYKDINAVRLSIIGWCGYRDGLPSEEDAAEWFTESVTMMPLPATWRAVAHDKFTNEVREVIDLGPWYKRLFELRELTVKYGSAARNLFKKLDDKGETAEFRYLLTVRNLVTSQYGSTAAVMTDEQKAEFDAILKVMGVKKADMRKVTNAHSCAACFRNDAAAAVARLTYKGELALSVVDMETLQEIVTKEPTPA
jgi:hypothetical protein